jgi:hypothetical protein
MARLAAFTIPGLECYIPSGDHLPPHIHVRKPGAWEIKVLINHVHHGNPELPYLPVRPRHPSRKGQVPSPRELQPLREAILAQRRALLREFHAVTTGAARPGKTP